MTLDGEEREGVGLIKLQPRFGKPTYGLCPEGYDAWVFQEAGCGALTIPCTHAPDGELLVGLLLEKHTNMGEDSM
ncbi:hypothetical protein COX00_01275 [Candidatus Uhrbacteria bacterium CG22_combo_CG10-13_8_21_14_all_47_17]|uniref:Uncharacterized protein n=1 Tax=Candidatus Uhrbacteria bacterium CG22_combo_CG10-13_8_21_14_all_47_17 TaxID=1975041 RepID=A0A2H0BT24_9BACT|nr:MAG: hypothetical protein COX00_01275 [Candidatus Uhrbacteria bacterium CG22_combo_CG10-13_8_21_14_all_47_17]